MSTDPASPFADCPVDLDALLADLQADASTDGTPVKQPFVVHDERTANWLVRRLKQARAYGAHVAEWAEVEKRRAAAEEQHLLFLYGAQLRTWVTAELERLGNRKRKSLALPAGLVGYRHQGPHLAIDDETALLAWCRANLPGAVKVTESLIKSALTEHFEATGEVPEQGAHMEQESERFFIR